MNLKNISEFMIFEEFHLKLDKMLALKNTFEALMPRRQKASLLHFSFNS